MRRILLFAVVVVVLLVPGSMFGQTLTTAETLGKEKKSLFLAESGLFVQDFTTLNYAYGQYIVGLADKFDLYVGPGIVTGFGRSQANFGVGGNLGLLKSKSFNVSFYNFLSTGLNKRDESSTALLFSAVVASRNFQGFSLYFGYSVLSPLGRVKDKLFTPPEPFHNVPVGVMIPLGSHALFVEYDYGRKMKVVAIGYAFPP